MIPQIRPNAGDKLLLVEDEAMVCNLLCDHLMEVGFAVTAFRLPEDAMEALDSVDYSILISDIRLPGAWSGWDVARKAREQYASIAVLYISADSDDSWASRGVPGSVFLRKPFTLTKLDQAIRVAQQELRL